jgi:xanthine dehydrogenase YagS FAD-binding subunit
MRPFEYASPTSDKQALGLLGANWNDAAVFAGGTDLLSLMKDDIVHPKRLVNVKQVPGMDRITMQAGGLRVGALVRIADFADNADVRRHYPTLATAADDAASPQIRNLATMGGNLCQRPRCWYFRNGFGLLAMRDGKSLVLEGDNRYHAILGNEGPAYFVSPSSIAPALIAHGARVRILGPGGAREVALEKFFVIPKSEDEREHDLKPNEVLAEIFVPSSPAGLKSAQYEVRQKTTFDWPLATASVALTMSGNTVKSARVVLGHVAPVPWISQEAAQALEGHPLNEQTAAAAGQAAVSQAKGLGRNDYKIQLTRVAVKRALLAAAGRGVPEPRAGADRGATKGGRA